MKPSQHVIASVGVSLVVQVTTHSWPATAGCFFSGVLIDIDHFLDYYLLRKQFPFNYKELVKFCWDVKVSKVYLFFHAYEYLLVLWFLIFLFHLGMIWLGVTIGLTSHIVFDQFTNPIKPMFYFLSFRVQNQFEKSKTVSEAYYLRKLKI